MADSVSGVVRIIDVSITILVLGSDLIIFMGTIADVVVPGVILVILLILIFFVILVIVIVVIVLVFIITVIVIIVTSG